MGTFTRWWTARARAAGPVLLALAASAWAQVPPGVEVNAVNGATARTELGFGIFQHTCLNCHGKPEYERAPTPAALREMSPEHLYDVLTNGIMQPIVGKDLSDQERRMVSESIAGRLIGAAASGDAAQMPNRCSVNPPLSNPAASPGWNGWGADGANSRFQDGAHARLTPEAVRHLQLRWAFGFPNSSSAYGQPSIIAGRVFVGADTGYVYSLDAKSGCVYWSYLARSGVRNAMTVEPIGRGARYAVFFGDLKANAYAVDAQTGRELWVTHVEDHLTDRVTAAPAYHAGRLYVPISSWEEFRAMDPTYSCCTSVGAVAALDANTGVMLWKTYVISPRPAPTRLNNQGVQQFGPAGASVWNTPTVDPARHAIYVGTGDATTYPAAETSDAVMALDMASGRVLWSYQAHRNDSFLVGCGANAPTHSDNCPKFQGPDWDIPGSVILRRVGAHRELIVGTKPGDILALDPDHGGALLWRKNVSGGALAGDGPAFPTGTRKGVQWGGAASADTVYYGLTDGGVVALGLRSGERLWFSPLNREQNPRANNSAAVTAIPGAVFVGGTDGMLFAVSSTDGSPLWSFETARTYHTVNQVPAKGGSISAPGVTVADGMVFVGSGFSVTAGEPGNVILAFAPGP